MLYFQTSHTQRHNDADCNLGTLIFVWQHSIVVFLTFLTILCQLQLKKLNYKNILVSFVEFRYLMCNEGNSGMGHMQRIK